MTDYDNLMSALMDGHPNPEGFLEWFDSLSESEKQAMSKRNLQPTDGTNVTPPAEPKKRKSPNPTEYNFYGVYDAASKSAIVIVKLGRSASHVFLVLLDTGKTIGLAAGSATLAAYGADLNANKAGFTHLGAIPLVIEPREMAAKLASILAKPTYEPGVSE